MKLMLLFLNMISSKYVLDDSSLKNKYNSHNTVYF